MSWREDWLREQEAAERQRKQQRQQRLAVAAELLHERLEEFCRRWCLTEAELVELLAAEGEWYGGEVAYELAHEDA